MRIFAPRTSRAAQAALADAVRDELRDDLIGSCKYSHNETGRGETPRRARNVDARHQMPF